jgi:hypothetical protein
MKTIIILISTLSTLLISCGSKSGHRMARYRNGAHIIARTDSLWYQDSLITDAIKLMKVTEPESYTSYNSPDENEDEYRHQIAGDRWAYSIGEQSGHQKFTTDDNRIATTVYKQLRQIHAVYHMDLHTGMWTFTWSDPVYVPHIEDY